MQMDLEKIEQKCNRVWGLTTELRELVVTAKKSEILDLSGEQKQSLKDAFMEVKKELKTEVDNILI